MIVRPHYSMALHQLDRSFDSLRMASTSISIRWSGETNRLDFNHGGSRPDVAENLGMRTPHSFPFTDVL